MSMVTDLVELQKIDRKILHLRRERQTIPERLAEQERGIARAKVELREAEEEVKKKIVRSREKEKDLAGLGSVLAQKEIHLNQAKNNREYEVLTEEVKKKLAERESLEVAILELIEETEALQAANKAKKEGIAKFEEAYRESLAKVEEELREIDGNLAEWEAMRAKKLSEFADSARDLIELYERIFAASGGQAIVPMEDEACGFCFIHLSANDSSTLKSGCTIFCKNCGRIVYLPR